MPASTLPTSIPSSIQELTSLEADAMNDSTAKAQYTQVLPYVLSSLTIGRHLDHAVIVALGRHGHGKSKTINTLIGKNLLLFARPSEGSTTKAIQRISIQNPDSNTGVNVRLACDDTPGLFGTKYESREKINNLLRQYDKHYHPHRPPDDRLTQLVEDHRYKVYPNAILLVTTWDSIRGNCPPSLRETMGNLRESGLIDHEHPNVIVVVTKSLSFWNDYEDFDSDPEKDRKWQEDADEKKRIIDDLRLKIFPSSTSWQVVFVENGGGQSILQDFKRLPNGELSHRNLFEAIRNLFAGADLKKGDLRATATDLVGMEALRFLTGDRSIISGLKASPPEILFQSDDSNLEGIELNSKHTKHDAHSRSSASGTTHHSFVQVAKNHLGFCYNPIRQTFGGVPVIIMNDSDIEITPHPSRQESKIDNSNTLEEVESAAETHLGLEFDMPAVFSPRVGSTAATTSARTVQSSQQHVFKATKRTAVARLKLLTPEISSEARKEIDSLPPWDDSSEVKDQYLTFFNNHGTHVNVQAALGGVLCVLVQGGSVETMEFLKAFQFSADAPVASQFGIRAGMFASRNRKSSGDRSSAQASISVDRIGGGIVDAQLTTTLSELFAFCRSNSSHPSAVHGWVNARSRWIEALQTDSAFCPQDRETQYMWLCDLEGLNSTQKIDLRTASEWYLRRNITPSTTDSLHREDLNQVGSTIKNIFERSKHEIVLRRSSTFRRAPAKSKPIRQTSRRASVPNTDMEIILDSFPPDAQQSSMAQPEIQLPSIREWPDRKDTGGEEYRRVVLPYAESSLRIGRHLDRFVVLLLGEMGHGKTKTINRLVSKNLLEVAQPSAGSTTKVVERVNVPIRVDSNGDVIELTASFDDTPGFGGTVANDGERHQELLDRYAENHFQKLDESQQIYPNVILIVTSWDSVKGDENDPNYFTPSIGKTIQYLSRSRLVDNKRGNVIVVVTKSLSFLNDYEDFNSQGEKDACWRDDASTKMRIINNLRSKAFEGSDSDWPVVFVENGGGASAKRRHLPNGEIYPANLFNAILVSADCAGDLVGKVALQYLKAAHDHLESRAETRGSPTNGSGFSRLRLWKKRTENPDSCSIKSEVLEAKPNFLSFHEVLNGSSSKFEAANIASQRSFTSRFIWLWNIVNQFWVRVASSDSETR